MAQQNNDLFQRVLRVFYDILRPGLDLLTDPLARTEMLESLGMSAAGTPAFTAPTGSNLEAYINKEDDEVQPFQLAGAILDATQIGLALEGFFRAAHNAVEGEDDNAVSELVSAFLNLMTLEYLRRRAPGLYSFIQIMNVIDARAAAQGGSANFLTDTVWGFFERLAAGFDSFETQEHAKAVSDPIFTIVSGVLFAVDMVLRKHEVDALEIRSGYGYEGFRSSRTPNTDLIADRALSYSVKIKFPEVLQGNPQLDIFNTLVFVPRGHGGVSLVTRLAATGDATFKFDTNKAIKIKATGDGIFRIGNQPEASAGPSNRLAATFEHKSDSPSKFSLLDKPRVKLGIGTYNLGFAVVPDDFEIKLNFDLHYEFGRGDLTGFPFTLLPENQSGKQTIGVGFALKKGAFADGGGSVGAKIGGANEVMRFRRGERDIVEELVKVILNALNLRIPIHQDIGGVVGFETIYIKAGVSDGFEEINLEVSLDFWLKFGGVVTLSVSRLGLLLKLPKLEGGGGVLGYDIKPDIKMPTGAGVRVNAEVIKGGGFLYLDDEKGEYFGSLELEFKSLFTLKAVGIINTKMPDGSEGFAMFILITAEFSPIQLGFGFTLLGVGGLVGIHRTVNPDEINKGLRTNAIKSILFPEDVVGNIHRIISDIKNIFPIEQDTFVIGLMGKLGWGTPTLVSLELGIILKLPDPSITLLGVLKIALPTPEAAIVKIQLNFFGYLDFQNGFLFFRGDLYDSQIVGLTLTGSLVLAVSWGNEGVFVLSLGGFHPDFREYPTIPGIASAFQGLQRIGIQLLAGDNPRFGVECYFAVTSNSVQFGAKAELYAEGPLGFNLYGKLQFDALFIFNPFSFVISLEAVLAIRQGEDILFGIRFYGKLSGPTPWHIEGEVTFGLLFIDVTIGVSATWGDSPTEVGVATADLAQMLKDELKDNRNWKPEIPDYHHLYVSVREIPEEEMPELLIHPFGAMVFNQQKVPLNYQIEKFGNSKVEGPKKFAFTKIVVGTTEQTIKTEKSLFAPGHYTPLSESEKVSRKSFERLDAGVRLDAAGALRTSPATVAPAELDYELDYTYDDKPLVLGGVKMGNLIFSKAVRNAAASKSAISLRNSGLSILNKPETAVAKPAAFAVASSADLKSVGVTFFAETHAEAVLKMQQLVTAQPAMAGKVQVVESFELAI
jgi:hypothetical protein